MVKYKSILQAATINYISLKEQNDELTDKKPVFSKIDIKIIKNNILEIRLPFLPKSKFEPLIKFFKEDIDLQFEYRKNTDPVWSSLIRDESIFNDIFNHQIIKEIGYNIDNNKMKNAIESIKLGRKEQKKLFELSTMAQLKETNEFKGIFKKLYPFQQVAVEYSKYKNRIFLADGMGLGKAQSLDSIVFTPTGKKQIGDIKVGDQCIGSDGLSTNVIGVYPQGKKELYRVHFNDNTSVLVGKEHLWTVSQIGKNKWRVLTTEQMMNINGEIETKENDYNKWKTYKIKTYFKELNGNNKWQIPTIKPIVFEQNDNLPIDPYLFGLLIRNGSFRHSIIISNKEKFIITEVKQLLPNNVCLKKINKYDYRIKMTKLYRKNHFFNPFKQIIKELELYKKYSYEKFIPDIYKYSSINNRLKLLQGLMDSNGYAGNYSTEYSTTSERLANDVRELVNTLGGIAQKSERILTYIYKGIKKQGRKSYRLNIKLPLQINLFKLERKSKSYKKSTKYHVNRYITDIKYEKTDKAVCIAVDAPDCLYATEHCILTHNTIQALAIIEYHQLYPSVVVVPAMLKGNWKKELNKWIPHKKTFVIESKVIPDADIFIISYNMVENLGLRLKNRKIKGVFLDESHFIKSENSKRSKAIKKYFKDVQFKVLATGTPILNRTVELVSQLDFLGILDSHFGGRRKFVNRYAPPHWNGWGTTYGSANEEELQVELRKSCMIRRMKKDVIKELPKKIQQTIYIPLSDYNKYRKIERDSLVWYEEKLKNQNLNNNEIYKLVKEKRNNQSEIAEKLIKVEYLRQAAVEYKMDSVFNWIDIALEQIDKLVVFAHHRNIIEMLYEKYKTKSVMLYGGMSGQVDNIINEFINNKNIKLFIGSLTSAGIGIDGLQTVASNVVFVELAWTPALMEQAADRCYRIGQTEPVNIYYLIGEKSVEEYIFNVVLDKQEIFEKASNINKLFEWIKKNEKK